MTYRTWFTSLTLLLSLPLAAQSWWRGRCETPVSLAVRTGFDSNPLRLAQGGANQENRVEALAAGEEPQTRDSGQSDSSAYVRPWISVRCAVTSKTSVWGTSSFGMERFLSTKVLNTTAYLGELRVLHRLSPAWTAEAYGVIERSNQPDVLSNSAVTSFAKFLEERGGIRMLRSNDRGTTFFEYSAQPRRYARLTLGSATHQRDTLQALTVGRWWSLTPVSTLGLRADYLRNASNEPLFRYSEPIVSLSYARSVGNGIRVDATARIRHLSFSSRPISTDPTRMRSDLIPGISIAVRKELSRVVSATATYAYDKDFSTEPLRRFNAHRLFFTIDLALGRSRPSTFVSSDNEVHPFQAAQVANLGYEEIKRGNWNEALRLSLQAIQLDSTLPEAHTNAGIAYYKLGKREAAVTEWTKSLALRPDQKIKDLLNKVTGK